MLDKVKKFLKDHSYRLDNGCIQWKSLDVKGRTRMNNWGIANEFGITYAHRLAYMIYIDNNLQEKKDLRLTHSCNNTGCINANHLREYIREGTKDPKDKEESYYYYNKGNYVFYLKSTGKIIRLDTKRYIVEKGKVFRISYIEPFDEILKEECTNIGVLCKGEELC